MAQLKTYQTNLNSGELDPRLAARGDVTHYFNGVDKARNVVLLPQGGAKRRPGSEWIGKQVKKIADIDTSGFTITAPEGGTASNADDGDEANVVLTNTGASTDNPFVIIHVNCLVPTAVRFFDVRLILLTSGAVTSDGEVRVQSSPDNSVWTDFGLPIDSVTSTGKSRRFTSTTDLPVTARYWRVVRIGATDLSTDDFSVAEIHMMSETGAFGDVEHIDFKFSNTQTYEMFLTQGNLRVIRDGVFQADIRVPFTEAQIANSSYVQSLDTLFIFDENVQTHRIARQGADDEWHDDLTPYVNLPTFEFDILADGVITMTSSLLTLEDVTTLTASAALFTAAMVGHTVHIRNGVVRLTAFTSNVAMDGEVIKAVDATDVTTKFEIREPAWSAARGWPKCGTLSDGRLWVAGSKDLPNGFWGSRVNQLFDFNEGSSLSNEAIIRSLDTDSVASIFAINAGRHLQMFTSAMEFYFLPDDSALTPANIVGKINTEVGAKGPGLRVAKLGGAVLFIEREGRGVREFLFVDKEQPYSTDTISLLASHLIDNPVDFRARRSQTESEGDLALLVNSDGTMAVLQTLRSQQITGWSHWSTNGSYKAVGVDNDADIYSTVERTVGGVAVRMIERFSNDFFMDCATQFVGNGVAITFSGLDHLEGETLETRTDGFVTEDVTVSGGEVTMLNAPFTLLEVGLAFPDVKEGEVVRLQTNGHSEREARQMVFGSPTGVGQGDQVWIKDMPVSVDLPDGTSVDDNKAVVDATLKLFETSGIYVGANGEPPVEVSFRPFSGFKFGEPQPLFTGTKEIEGFMGWDLHAQLEVTQRSPVPFTLLGIVRKVSL